MKKRGEVTEAQQLSEEQLGYFARRSTMALAFVAGPMVTFGGIGVVFSTDKVETQGVSISCLSMTRSLAKGGVHLPKLLKEIVP